MDTIIANVGQKVRCIDGHLPAAVREWTSDVPKEGHVYTVSAVSMIPHVETNQSEVSYQLLELKDGEIEDDTTFFRASRFVVLPPE